MERTTLVTVVIMVALAGCKGKSEAPTPAPEAPAAAPEQPPAAPEEKRARTEAAPAVPAGPDLLPLGRPDARVKVQPPAQVKYNQAKKAHKAKDRQTAIQLLEESLEADPTFSWAILLRARMHLQDGEKKECAALLERLLAYNHVHFAPQIRKLAWLKPLRSDPEAWGPLEERMGLYREAWVKALAGPGAFFVQSQYRKIEGADIDGEPLDLRWARGVPVFWSKDLGRYLVIGEHTDVAGFLVDRENNALVLVRWQPHEEGTPGLMGKVLAHRIDLLEAEAAPRSIEIAAEAEVIRTALDAEGNLLFTTTSVEEEEALDDLEETVEEDVVEAEAEEALEEDEADEADEEEGVDEEEEVDGEEVEGEEYDRVNWEKGVVDAGVLDTDGGWLLTVTLAGTEGPDAGPLVDTDEDPPRAKRGGKCQWIAQGTAFCFEPTKKGGTWHDLDLHEAGGADRLTEEPIPLVQY
jgi:hypothetical protein